MGKGRGTVLRNVEGGRDGRVEQEEWAGWGWREGCKVGLRDLFILL